MCIFDFAFRYFCNTIFFRLGSFVHDDTRTRLEVGEGDDDDDDRDGGSRRTTTRARLV